MVSTLGISFGYHDSSVALITNEGKVYAEHEERFTRLKFDSGFPKNSLNWLLELGLTSDIRGVFYYEDPRIKQRRLVSQYINNPPKSNINNEVLTSIKLTTVNLCQKA